MQTKIPSDKLITGMYVADIDRPWIETPFWFQGFLIENDEHLMLLRQFCKFVMVDPDLSTSNAQAAMSSFGGTSGKFKEKSVPSSEAGLVGEFGEFDKHPSFVPANVKLTPFRTIVAIEAELAPAGDVYTRTAEVLNDLFKDLASNNYLALQDVESVIQGMVESMVRNPDALMLVSRMRQEDKTLYGHG